VDVLFLLVPLRFALQIARLRRVLLKSKGTPAKVSLANIPFLAGNKRFCIFFVNTGHFN
jgi:hypothetical protein